MALGSSARKTPTSRKGWARANATRKRWLTLVKDSTREKTRQQMCPTCHRWISTANGEWEVHQETHTISKASRPQPVALPANPTKTRERQRRAGAGETPTATPKARRPPLPDPSEKEGARTVRVWRNHLAAMEKYMATGQGQPPSVVSPFAKAIADAFTRWGDHIPQTRDEIQADLIGMTAALGIGANAVRSYAQNSIVGQKLHPTIASPVENAADGLDEDRLEFTRAYVLLLRIYAAAIEHEEQSGPKPEAEFWKSG